VAGECVSMTRYRSLITAGELASLSSGQNLLTRAVLVSTTRHQAGPPTATHTTYHTTLVLFLVLLLAVSTRPPDGVVSALRASIFSALVGLCPPYLSRETRILSALAGLCKSFISIRQVAPHDLDLDLD